MDIYSYINSKDIAEHCRTIGHEFTPLEMAFIVYLSDKTLSKRHDAWQWIIDTQQDTEVAERVWTPHYDSLHQFLKDYMKIENKLLAQFIKDEPDAFYHHFDLYASDGSCICDGESGFSTFGAVLAEIEQMNAEYCGGESDAKIERVRVKKRRIGTECVMEAWVNPDGEAVRAFSVYGDGWESIYSEAESKIYSAFEGMWMEVPTPFKKGDIVINKSLDFPCDSSPFVLERLCHWPDGEWTQEFIDRLKKDWDDTDMTAWGYGISEQGDIFREHFMLYPNLEYYRDELKGKDRTLLALSNYIKEKPEISEDLLLNAYEVFRLNEYSNYHLGWYADEYLEMTGLKENRTSNDKPPEHMKEYNDIYSFIPSRDIEAHCRTLGHTFTPLEMAVIIWHSKKPLAERHKAWQNIIDTQPDMKIIEWAGSKNERMLYESLHQLLKDYIRIENSLADKLKTKERDAVYTYAVEYTYENPFDYDDRIVYDKKPYSTYEAVIGAIKKECEEEPCSDRWKSRTFCLYKRFIDTDKFLSVQVKPDGEIISGWDGAGKILEEADYNIFTALSHEISIYIPAPFHKGDILTYSNNRPFVLTYDEWKYGQEKCPEVRQYLAGGSITDTIYGYFIHENGHIYGDFNPAALNMEYYRAELKGLNRVLKAISNHIKGEIPVHFMMDAYDIILHEEQRNNLRDNLCYYTDEGLALIGLQKKKGTVK